MATPRKRPVGKATPGQSKSTGKTRQQTATATGDCNPCFEQSAGLLTCDGSAPVVIPFPAAGEWFLVVKDGQPRWEPTSGVIPDPQPAPTDPELDPPDAEPMPPAPAPATE